MVFVRMIIVNLTIIKKIDIFGQTYVLSQSGITILQSVDIDTVSGISICTISHISGHAILIPFLCLSKQS